MNAPAIGRPRLENRLTRTAAHGTRRVWEKITASKRVGGGGEATHLTHFRMARLSVTALGHGGKRGQGCSPSVEDLALHIRQLQMGRRRRDTPPAGLVPLHRGLVPPHRLFLSIDNLYHMGDSRCRLLPKQTQSRNKGRVHRIGTVWGRVLLGERELEIVTKQHHHQAIHLLRDKIAGTKMERRRRYENKTQ